jgi:REP element-mobilizing transposase RayT
MIPVIVKLCESPSKYRKKSIYKDLRKYLGATLKDLALQKECTIEEGHSVHR